MIDRLRRWLYLAASVCCCQYLPACLPYGIAADADGRSLQLSALLVSLELGRGGPTTQGCGCAVEGGAATSFVVVLQSQPGSDVAVTATPDPQLTLNGAAVAVAITFTRDNWNVPQTTTVEAVDDDLVEGNHQGTITYSLAGDPDYLANSSFAPLAIPIQDNDAAGVFVTGAAPNVSEAGGTTLYQLRLSSKPTADVVLSAAFDNSQLRLNASAVSPQTLTFTPVNWNVDQNVTVGAVNDAAFETNPHASTVTHTTSSADTNYNGLAGVAPTVASITENDTVTVGGNVSGLAGATNLQLLNNGGDALTVNADGNFTFGTGLFNGVAYTVTVSANPTGRNCLVANGTGTMGAGNVTNVAITCYASSFAAISQNININGTGTTNAPVGAGAGFTVSFDFAINSAGCPGCVSPVVVGIAGNPTPPALCAHGGGYTYIAPAAPVFLSTGNLNLTAPVAPGTYDIRMWNAWDFCSNMVPAYTTQGTTIGTITVP